MLNLNLAEINKFLQVWWQVAKMSAQDQLTTNWGGYLFIIGKVLWFLIYFVFIYSVLSSTALLAGYSRDQVILFFLIYNLIDITSQFLFRGVYSFRWRVVSGDFDLDLVKPLPSFFQPIFAWTDILDFLTLIPLTGYTLYYIFSRQLISDWTSFFLFGLLLINALVITFGIHLLIAAIVVMTTEIDHLIWMWRDLFGMARIPTDVYPAVLRFALTLLIPIIVIVTFPTKTLLGILNPGIVFLAIGFGIVFLIGVLKFWQFALKNYHSASS